MSKKNDDFFKSKNEWSVIKDRLLGCYLTPYFQKVLLTGKPIYYVDCFAGKGKFEDGNDGSPLIALKIREGCLKRTKRREKYGAIKTCFIDREMLLKIELPFDEEHLLPYEIPFLIQFRRLLAFLEQKISILEQSRE